MRAIHRFRRKIGSRLLVWALGVGIGGVPARAQSPPPEPQAPPPLEGPATGVEALPSTSQDSPRAGVADSAEPMPATSRETSPPSGDSDTAPARVRIPKPPPAPIAERPSRDRPDPRARWIPGHWEWDPSRADFLWVGGSWRIPPAGMTWVAGRWSHDADGWSWIPGAWSPRDRATAAVAANRPTWRTTGPPVDHPDDTPGPAPSRDSFYVSGHYAPAGDQLVWRPGAWARIQPGWDWLPARWVRRPDGWEFRQGYWVRDPATVVAGTTRVRRRFAARPGAFGRPPAILDSDPGPDGATDRPPPPTGPAGPEDPIAEAEVPGPPGSPGRAIITEIPPIVSGPVTGMPYYVIRPPGAYPYGPSGVIVPGVVPPFVRRMLDQVLP